MYQCTINIFLWALNYYMFVLRWLIYWHLFNALNVNIDVTVQSIFDCFALINQYYYIIIIIIMYLYCMYYAFFRRSKRKQHLYTKGQHDLIYIKGGYVRTKKLFKTFVLLNYRLWGLHSHAEHKFSSIYMHASIWKR